MSKNIRTTQKDMCEKIIVKMETLLIDGDGDTTLKMLNDKLSFLVGQAQNSPPDGASDGSIAEPQWYLYRRITELVNDLYILLNQMMR